VEITFHTIGSGGLTGSSSLVQADCPELYRVLPLQIRILLSEH
jgi:hypothetical protein